MKSFEKETEKAEVGVNVFVLLMLFFEVDTEAECEHENERLLDSVWLTVLDKEHVSVALGLDSEFDKV